MSTARALATLAGLSLAAFPLAAFPLAASADELYRQNPQQSFSGPSAQDARNPGGLGLMYVTADNFPAAAGTTITSVEFWGGYPRVQPGNTHGFMIRFYQDNGGTIGPMISTQDVFAFTETVFYTHPSLGWPGYHYTLNLVTPFSVPAAGQYWFATVAILDFGGTAPDSVQWGWVQSTAFNPPNAVQSIFGGPFNSLQGDMAFVLHGTVGGGGGCYPNCDESTTAPILNVADFGCFLTKYAAGEAYANCDESTTPPVLNVADFGCFLTRYAAGCP